MKLAVKNNEYYQLQQKQGITLFDNFKEAAKEMMKAVKGENAGEAKLWQVSREKKSWQMVEVSYKDLFEMLVKGE